MKRTIFTLLIAGTFAFIATEAEGQTKTKPRIGRKTEDNSLTRFKQRRMLKVTDTTGIGIERADTVMKFGTKPQHPRIPPQNNPNPHSPNPTLVNPERQATPVNTTAPPDSTATK